MPTYVETYRGRKYRVPYATEQETLDFANMVREAGGADLLTGLLPAQPVQNNACLIAKALNFGCSVDGLEASEEHPAEHIWGMCPDSLSIPEIEALAVTLGLEVEEDGWTIRLPRLIGNVAAAFDSETCRGWVAKYRQESDTES